VFLFAMNKARYESLPDDLRQVIDANSGITLAQQIGKVWDAAEQPGRQAAADLGDAFYTIEGEELARWQAATASVMQGWIAERDAAGQDGQALVDAARALIARYAGE
jgi:TRAP-type C4-dicarboxylate transport system substrate-binding protein